MGNGKECLQIANRIKKGVKQGKIKDKACLNAGK